MTTATKSPAPSSAAPPAASGVVRRALTATADRLRGLRSGELGAWPVIIGLVIIWVVFQSLNDRFLTSQNLYNMSLQIAATGVISVGVVLVLLLGEIDLSVGSVAGVCAAALGVLWVRHGLPWWLALLLVLVLGGAIGLLQGSIFARVGVPAFVVTLAGNLGWGGMQLWLLAPQGTINVPDKGFIYDLTHLNLNEPVAWALGALIVLAYAASLLAERRRRVAAGLPARAVAVVVARIVGLAVLVFGVVAVLNSWLGVPIALLIFVGLVVLVDLMLRRTRYGRTIFAVGGNVEAARRAGVNVAAVRISVFALCSLLAAFGGVLLTSRNIAVSQSTGGGEVVLLAIAAAVIGGVSLFGGRGNAYGALLGGLVLGSIQSGMFLLQLNSSVRLMITAGVLLLAVVLDSISRRGRRASGRQ